MLRRRAALLLLPSLLASSQQAAALDPAIHFPPEYDCAMKQLALTHARSLLRNSSAHRRAATWSDAVFTALELGPKCNASRPAPWFGPDAAAFTPAPPAAPPPSGALFVAPDGSDAAGDGTKAKPFLTLRRAVLAARLAACLAPSAAPPAPATIVMRGESPRAASAGASASGYRCAQAGATS